MLEIEGICVCGKVCIIFRRDGDKLKLDRDECVNGEGRVKVVNKKSIRIIYVNLIGACRPCSFWVGSKVVET